MAAELELATNQMLRELSVGLPDMLTTVDAELANEDTDMSSILGQYYVPFSTPQPVTWKTGGMPLYTTLEVEEYPVLTCSSTSMRPTAVEGGDWQEAMAEMVVQVICISSDTIFLFRFMNRYANAIQRVLKNSTLNELTEPISTQGRIDISNAMFREYDESKNSFYAQSMMYRFRADFVVI